MNWDPRSGGSSTTLHWCFTEKSITTQTSTTMKTFLLHCRLFLVFISFSFFFLLKFIVLVDPFIFDNSDLIPRVGGWPAQYYTNAFFVRCLFIFCGILIFFFLPKFMIPVHPFLFENSDLIPTIGGWLTSTMLQKYIICLFRCLLAPTGALVLMMMLLIKVALKINKTCPNKKVALKIDKTRPN